MGGDPWVYEIELSFLGLAEILCQKGSKGTEEVQVSFWQARDMATAVVTNLTNASRCTKSSTPAGPPQSPGMRENISAMGEAAAALPLSDMARFFCNNLNQILL